MTFYINNNLNYKYNNPINSYQLHNKLKNFPILNPSNKRILSSQNFDSVSFGGRRSNISAEERMTNYANNLLRANGLRKGQPIYIKGDSYYLPFMQILAKEAYKNHSGYVLMDVQEQSLETLKKKYNKTKDFNYKKIQIEKLKDNNAIFFEFNKDNDPYQKARVYKTEALEEYKKKYTIVPPRISKLFKIKPQEILIECLDLHKNQPVQIVGEREHIPLIKKLLQYLYAKNGTELVDITINNSDKKTLLLYADDEVLEKAPEYKYPQYIELAEKKSGVLNLCGSDSRELEDIDAERISKESDAWDNDDFFNAIDEMSSNLPWVMYYAPTTMSSVDAYPELANDKLKMLSQAYIDANKINRIGHLKEHAEALAYRIKKLNELIDAGYRTFQYKSIDPQTNLPDGKTDFTIKVSPNSHFHGGRLPMPKYNHNPLVNVPTEEVFTAPLNDSAQGKITTTKPLSHNGRVITDLSFEFKDGKVISLDATKNKDILINNMQANQELNRLGELAIVADSPIAKTNRVFNNTLLDENAACHLALGYAYEFTLKNVPNFDTNKELNEWLAKEKINPVTGGHIDFMIGGKNVLITAINEETGDIIYVIKDDKFLL